MSRKVPSEMKEYSVNVNVFGIVNRTVLATSQGEAERMVEKTLFQPDKQTPQSKMLCAFDWHIPRFHTFGEDVDRYGASTILGIGE